MLKIKELPSVTEQIMPLLLLGDESERMIAGYIKRGHIFTGEINERSIAVCVITIEPGNWIEIKNLAVLPEMHRKGIGRAMLAYVESKYPDYRFKLGTGETPSTLNFYKSCGYCYSHRIENFFTDNYDHPIFEDGVQLKDMIYLTKFHD